MMILTKLDESNKTTSKKVDDEVMSANSDVIVIFPVYGQFGQNAWSVKVTFSLTVTFYLTKTENRTNKKSLTQPSHYCVE